MASIIQNLPSLDPVVLTSISESLFEGFFQHLELNRYHSIQTGIKAKKQIIIFGKHTGLAGYNKTGCDTTANTSWGIPSQEKVWTPAYLGDRFEECYDNYMDTFIRWGLNNGVAKSDLTGTELAAMITEHVGDLLMDVSMRHAWFGDTAIAAGTGNNLAAGDLKYFNAIDGFWAQLFDIVGVTPTKQSTTGLTTKNGGASYALQAFDATDTTNQVVTTALDQMWYDADMRLRGMAKSDLVFMVSQSVYDQYEKERKATGGSGIYEVFLRQENGAPLLSSNGVEVVPVHDWDRIIQSYLEDGTAWNLPHRAVLTTRTNLMLGVEETSNLSEMDAWYSKDNEKYYIKFGFSLDAKVGLDNMVQLAY